MSKLETEKLKIILSSVFPGCQIPEDISSLKLGDLEEWDSLGNFNLLLAVEDEFSIKFDIEDMAVIKSIPDILIFLGNCR